MLYGTYDGAQYQHTYCPPRQRFGTLATCCDKLLLRTAVVLTK
jgi:hypothetical protein